MAKQKSSTAPRKASKPAAKSRTKAVKRPSGPSTVYQLKITLNDVRPAIWRRVQTGDCDLAELHDIIQIAMGWEDYHLHLFELGGERYGDPVQWADDFMDDMETTDERACKLSDLVARGVKKFTYEYDMGDDWRHTVLLEKSVAAEPKAKYPRCVAGERACPPEDCGGPWSYGDFVQTIADPEDERHEELLEWVGGEFDAEAFNVEAVNKRLAKLR